MMQDACAGEVNRSNKENFKSIESWLSKGAEFNSAEETFACFETANKIEKDNNGTELAISYFGMGKAKGKKSRCYTDHKDAYDHFNKALLLLDAETMEQDTKEELRADIQVQKAFSCAIIEKFDEGFEAIREASATYRALGDMERVGHAICHEGILLYHNGQKEDALAKMDEALTANRKDGDSWYNKYIIYMEMESEEKRNDAYYCLLKAKEYGTSVSDW